MKIGSALCRAQENPVHFYRDHMQINYDNFRDFNNFMGVKSYGTYKPGAEPLYSQSADVIRFYLSFWF